MRLIEACYQGNLDDIKKYKNYNVHISRDRLPLISASKHGYFQAVEYLLTHGAEVNMKNECKQTSLMYACYRGHFDIVKLLVSHGANINVKDHSGYTAVSYMSELGNFNITEFLVTHGAKLNIACTSGKNIGLSGLALINAAENGHLRIVKYLHERGSHINNLTLPRAAENGHLNTVKYLLEYITEINKRNQNWTPLSLAKMFGHERTVNLLFSEYLKYMIKVKSMLKFLGLENVYSVMRIILEREVVNSKIQDAVYS